MITLNLLPDIKKEYLQAQRTKRFFIFLSVMVSAGMIAIVLLMGAFVYGVQATHAENLQSDIDANIATLNSRPNLAEVLTVQKQLGVIPELHSSKPTVSSLFKYFNVLIPRNIELNQVELHFEESSSGTAVIEIKGTSDDFKTVNQFADALKNSYFTSDQTIERELAFTEVTLDTIGRSDQRAIFSLKANVNTLIFDSKELNLKLVVPVIQSSPSSTERPQRLFNDQSEAPLVEQEGDQ